MHSGDIRVIGTEAGRFSNCGHFGAVREINKQRQWIFIVLTVARVPAELELSQYSGI